MWRTRTQTVSVINATTNKVIAVVNMISVPFGIAVTPDGKNVYVANIGEYRENISNFDNNVSVIDTATNTVKTTVEVGSMPIAFGQFIGGRSVLKPVFPVADFSASVTSGFAPLECNLPTGRKTLLEELGLWRWHEFSFSESSYAHL